MNFPNDDSNDDTGNNKTDPHITIGNYGDKLKTVNEVPDIEVMLFTVSIILAVVLLVAITIVLQY